LRAGVESIELFWSKVSRLITHFQEKGMKNREMDREKEKETLKYQVIDRQKYIDKKTEREIHS
jgi:hypothetical protein